MRGGREGGGKSGGLGVSCDVELGVKLETMEKRLFECFNLIVHLFLSTGFKLEVVKIFEAPFVNLGCLSTLFRGRGEACWRISRP